MSKPITTDLRRWFDQHMRLMADDELREGFGNLCDAIDAVQENLERENDALYAENDALRHERDDGWVELDEGEPQSVGSAILTITPHIDWTAIAGELRAVADSLAGDV